MNKATEQKLSALHGAVAEVLTKQVIRIEEETEFNEDGLEVKTGKKSFSASPALIATAIKFLKDNEITCDAAQDENLGSLREALGNKQKHSRLKSGQVASLEDFRQQG